MAALPPVVVLDTSVLFSYVCFPARRYAIWEAVLDRRLAAVTCPAAVAELRDVSSRHVSDEQFAAFMERFAPAVMHVSDPPSRFVHAVDPKDSVFFDLAIETSAAYLVSYDKAHVLAVGRSNREQYDALHTLAPKLQLVEPIQLPRLITTM